MAIVSTGWYVVEAFVTARGNSATLEPTTMATAFTSQDVHHAWTILAGDVRTAVLLTLRNKRPFGSHVPYLPDQAIRLVPIMLCASVLWSSASCHATNRNATPTSTFEQPEKSYVPRFIPHELLVKFKSGISRERIEFILKHNGIDILSEIQLGRLYHVRISDDRSVESAITRLTSYQEIEYAEPNHRYEIQK